MPGPPPKPAAVRRRDGNPANRPIPDEALVGDFVTTPSTFPPPAAVPESVAAVWNDIVPDLVEIGLVRTIDATILEALCRAVARAREADAYLDEIGLHRADAPSALCDWHMQNGGDDDATAACAACQHAASAPPMPSFMHQGHRGATVHPAVRVARDSWAAAERIAKEYGMTAVGRLRVGAAVLQQKSLAEELKAAIDGDSDAAVEAALREVLDVDAGPP